MDIGRLVAPARALVASAALVWTSAACAAPAEATFVDRVRDAYPEVTEVVATDDRLVRLGRRACSPDGLGDADVEELRQIGLPADRFAGLAIVLCPSR